MVIKLEILEMVPVKGVICEEPRARIVNISQYPVSTLSVSHSVNDSMSRQGGISTVQPASIESLDGNYPSTYFQLNSAITFLQ